MLCKATHEQLPFGRTGIQTSCAEVSVLIVVTAHMYMYNAFHLLQATACLYTLHTLRLWTNRLYHGDVFCSSHCLLAFSTIAACHTQGAEVVVAVTAKLIAHPRGSFQLAWWLPGCITDCPSVLTWSEDRPGGSSAASIIAKSRSLVPA